ncbi:hypothetical protein GH714_023454 [Hevea brasiliensis]|uniref:UDP-glucuronic acid decarboxylase 1 n=1 Tax=Hevea brasiliensis TaxID=3981 RepID=A0A6A6LDM4_HEVBR|nr:hypothetical protein GH714_023454 [Hevea brasiliensis]
MGSELIFRGHEDTQHETDSYSPKPHKRWLSFTRPIRYVLREQRLVFVLVGIVIATLFFTILPSSSRNPYVHHHKYEQIPDSLAHISRESASTTYKFYEPHVAAFGSMNSGGKIPLGLKRKGLRIVVTGGAGFVGSHLVDRLIERGDSVIVVDNFFTGRKENVMHHFKNPRFELIRHDVVEPLLLEVDQIYHLACPASPVHYKHNPVKTIKTNVVGTLNMLGLAKRVGARFLLTSTSEVYGDPLQHPQVETYWATSIQSLVNKLVQVSSAKAVRLTCARHEACVVKGLSVFVSSHGGVGGGGRLGMSLLTLDPIQDTRVKEPRNWRVINRPVHIFNFGQSKRVTGARGVRSCYDEGKRTAETLTMDYHRGAGVEVRIARIFNTYGPRMCIDDGRVVSNFVAQALRKEPLTVYGDGKQTRSFQYVSDLVEGLMRLMEGEHVGPFNLGNPGEFTMLELAQVVQETIDPNARIEFRPNTEDDPHKRKPDITKAKDLLGWEPKVSLRKGLPLMVSDFRQRIFGDHKEDSTTSTVSTA